MTEEERQLAQSIAIEQGIPLARNPELLERQYKDILDEYMVPTPDGRIRLSSYTEEDIQDLTERQPIKVPSEPLITSKKVLLITISAIIFMIVANAMKKGK